jgi:bifunctional UDP-N-acetylglucosamine pyrophosphorylase/glucosamine-1-phosphate N-acetyltransferase
MIDRHQASKSVLTLMTTVLDDPFGYGRIITDADGGVVEIVEQKDANEEQRALAEINAGIYLVDANFLFPALQQVGTDNSQGEVYLTDIVSIATKQGHRVEKFIHTPAIDVLGVNSRVELARAHSELQLRYNLEVMLSGVTMYCPESILIAPDCVVGQDCVVQAGVHITGSTKIGSRVQIASGAVLHTCQVGDKAVIGANSVLRNCIVKEGEQVPPLTSRLS